MLKFVPKSACMVFTVKTLNKCNLNHICIYFDISLFSSMTTMWFHYHQLYASRIFPSHPLSFHSFLSTQDVDASPVAVICQHQLVMHTPGTSHPNTPRNRTPQILLRENMISQIILRRILEVARLWKLHSALDVLSLPIWLRMYKYACVIWLRSRVC